MSSVFDQIGGMTAVKTLVNEFYDVMERDPLAKELRAAHPLKIISTRNNLYRFLTHWFGGPKIFGDQYVNSEWLELRHRHVDLGEQFVQQWLYCMHTAMANLNLKGDLKNQLDTKLKMLIEEMVQVRGSIELNN